MSLKQQIFGILDAVAMVAGPPLRALITLAKWAINRYIPDTATAVALPVAGTVGAAPDAVKDIIRQIFDQAANLIQSNFDRTIVQKVADAVLNFFVDKAWDSLIGRIVPTVGAGEGENADAEKAAEAHRESLA